MHAYQHILVPVDFSPVSQRIIHRGKELAEQYQSKLTLLHVMQDIPLTVQSFGDMPGMMIAPEIQEQLLSQSQERLKQLASSLQVADTTLLEVVEGLPYDSISSYADEHQVDLIITGHSAKKGLMGFIMGSTAASIVKHSKCDVLVMQLPKSMAEA